MPSVFALGATGYIGGAVVFTLIHNISGIKITALMRNDKHAEVLSNHDITCVKGSNEDLPLITELASKADIVLNAADADSEAIIEAILEGCKRHLEDTKSKSVFIHTSGTAILGDGGEGTFNPLTPVYDDRDVDLIKSISPSAIHRKAEQKVVDADEMGYVSAYIVAPSTIYGQSTSPIPRVTLLTNLLLRMSRAVKGVPILADGSNVLNLTHIQDVASFYVTVIKHALSGDDHESGWGKYYFAAGYEYPLKSIAKAYAVVLHEKGIVDTAEPLVVTAAKLPIMKFFSGNSRAFPGRGTELGWRVTQPSIFVGLDKDVALGLQG